MNQPTPIIHEWPLPFEAFPKIPRLNRGILVTEKLDGTNALVYVDDAGGVHAGSRTRWIDPVDDNYGFARWVKENERDLRALGPGRHFGEWWGRGINRGYRALDRHFSLFNASRWAVSDLFAPTALKDGKEFCPDCCHVVPILYHGDFDYGAIVGCVEHLRESGSVAMPGYMKPEGVVIFHAAAQHCFKVTLEGDEKPKGAQ